MKFIHCLRQIHNFTLSVGWGLLFEVECGFVTVTEAGLQTTASHAEIQAIKFDLSELSLLL